MPSTMQCDLSSKMLARYVHVLHLHRIRYCSHARISERTVINPNTHAYTQISIDELNTHDDVLAFNNGCLYHIEQPPLVGAGIMSDYMFSQFEHDILDHQLMTPDETVNKLLFGISGNDDDVLCWNLVRFGTDTGTNTPNRTCDVFADGGMSGKSTAETFQRKSLKPKAHRLPAKMWKGPEKAKDEYSSEMHSLRFATMFIVDEASGLEPGNRSNSNKIKKRIQMNGVHTTVHNKMQFESPNFATFRAMQNFCKYIDYDATTGERLIVQTPIYTMKDPTQTDTSKFICIDKDHAMATHLKTKAAQTYYLNLVAQWYGCGLANPQLLEFRSAPPSVQEQTMKFRNAIQNGSGIRDYFSSLNRDYVAVNAQRMLQNMNEDESERTVSVEGDVVSEHKTNSNGNAQDNNTDVDPCHLLDKLMAIIPASCPVSAKQLTQIADVQVVLQGA
eukprot:769508_1